MLRTLAKQLLQRWTTLIVNTSTKKSIKMIIYSLKMTAIVAWCACWYLFSNSLAFTLYFVLFKLTIGLQLYYKQDRGQSDGQTACESIVTQSKPYSRRFRRSNRTKSTNGFSHILIFFFKKQEVSLEFMSFAGWQQIAWNIQGFSFCPTSQ